METSNQSDMAKYLNRNIQCYFTNEADVNIDRNLVDPTTINGKKKNGENAIKEKLRKTGQSFRKCVKAVLGKKKNTKTTQNTTSSIPAENYSIPRQNSSCELSSVLNYDVDDEDIPSTISRNAILEINNTEALGGKILQQYIGKISVTASTTDIDGDTLLTIDINRVKDLESNIDTFVQVSLLDYTMTETLACNTATVSSASHPIFEEKFSYELMPEDYYKRVFIAVWRTDLENEQDEFIGCTSFGVRNIAEKRNTVNGWYYLLDDSIGERKHVQVKDEISSEFREGVASFSQDSVSSGYGSCASNTL